jgi:hypothetical protein
MVIASTTLFFSGCASVDIERGVANVNREFRDFTGGVCGFREQSLSTKRL